MNANSRIYQQADGVTLTERAGEPALFSSEAGTMVEIDSIGVRIWEILAQPQSVATLAAILTTEFDVDLKICATHTEVLLDFLAEQRFVSLTTQEI